MGTRGDFQMPKLKLVSILKEAEEDEKGGEYRQKPQDYVSQQSSYGPHSKGHNDIGKELGMSPSMSHRVEYEAMLKYALFLMNPEWKVSHPQFRTLKGDMASITKKPGDWYPDLAQKLEDEFEKRGEDPDQEAFQKAYEEALIKVSKSPWFRSAIRDLFMKATGEMDMGENKKLSMVDAVEEAEAAKPAEKQQGHEVQRAMAFLKQVYAHHLPKDRQARVELMKQAVLDNLSPEELKLLVLDLKNHLNSPEEVPDESEELAGQVEKEAEEPEVDDDEDQVEEADEQPADEVDRESEDEDDEELEESDYNDN
jgi:hypothetical protein